MTLKSRSWFAMGMTTFLLLVGLSPIQAGIISAGYNDSFGLQADGSLWAWGYNGEQVGLVADYTTNHLDLVQESNQLGLNIPRSISHSLVDVNLNYTGYYRSSGYSTNTPTRVGTAASWVGIYSAGVGLMRSVSIQFSSYDSGFVFRTFGLQRDGSLWAWGYDGDPIEVTTTHSPSALYVGIGALGLGNRVVSEIFTYTNSLYETHTVTNYFAASVGVPTRIGTDSDWAAVAPGSEHALALKKNGSLWSWGYDGMGVFTAAVNANTNRDCNYAKGALGLGVDLLVSTWAITNGIGTSNEYVANEYVQPMTSPTQIGTATNWMAATAGYDHSLAIKSDGSLYAWGQNAWEDFVFVLTDATHYAEVHTNLYGVLGLGSVALLSTNTPTRVGTDLDWAKVAAGANCSFAIKKDGSLWAWGDNGNLSYLIGNTNVITRGYGRLGLGTNVTMVNVPTRIGTDNNWTDVSIPIVSDQRRYLVGSIAVTYSQPCLALKSDGSLWAWGYNWYPVLPGVGVLPQVESVPTRVGRDNDWVAIAAGVTHSLALKSDGSLWAWGDNSFGQLGNNNGSSFDPVQVGSLFTWGYTPPTPAVGDYDGDGKADFVLYDAATATWTLHLSSKDYVTGTLTYPIGGPGYRLVAADFDGDGKTDPAVYQEHTGTWQAMLSKAGWLPFMATGFAGGSGCAATAADYDGDGLADPTVYMDKTAAWGIRSSDNSYVMVLQTLGGAGSTPVPADYNNDGYADVATYQPSTGTWNILLGTSLLTIPSFGGMSYVPAVADYDGDLKADPAIYEPSTGRLRVKFSFYNYWEYDSAAYGGFLGGGRCVPVPADYDGDGHIDPAVYNYDTGKWTVLLSRWYYYCWTSPW